MQTAMTTTLGSPTFKYVGLIIAAASAGFLAGALYWIADTPAIQNPDLWRVGSVTAGALAALLAFMAAHVGADWPAPTTPRLAPSRRREERTDAAVLNSSEPDEKKLIPAIDRERERLRACGFSDGEISQILIARESSGNQARGSFGTGVATGLLNNVDAVVTHIRNMMPSFKIDIERMLDPEARTGERAGSAVGLAVKMAALVAIGYFVYIEALQLRSMAYKAWAEACIERQKNAINFTFMNDLMSGGGKLRELDKECAP